MICERCTSIRTYGPNDSQLKDHLFDYNYEECSSLNPNSSNDMKCNAMRYLINARRVPIQFIIYQILQHTNKKSSSRSTKESFWTVSIDINSIRVRKSIVENVQNPAWTRSCIFIVFSDVCLPNEICRLKDQERKKILKIYNVIDWCAPAHVHEMRNLNLRRNTRLDMSGYRNERWTHT